MFRKNQANKTNASSAPKDSVIRIPPFTYIHVLNQNDNVCRLVTGPLTFVRQDNETVECGPKSMVNIPPGYYCTVRHPVVLGEDNLPVLTKSGQIKVRHEELEVRTHQKPFPLYPGEVLALPVTNLTVIKEDNGLRLCALQAFVDRDGIKRNAGDEWIVKGPATYIPQVEARVVEKLSSVIVHQNEAIVLQALRTLVDCEGKQRVNGETWLVTKTGAYLPNAFEKVIEIVKAKILTQTKAIHVEAIQSFTDRLGKARKVGERWLVTFKECDSFIPSVEEKVVDDVDLICLSNREHCVVMDPVVDGKPLYGRKKLIAGPGNFFLQPEERLNGIQNNYVLGENEGLLIKAIESFTDEKKISRQAGDLWFVKGPCEYIPPVEITVVEKRKALALEKSEGVYVRDIRTGKVRLVSGQKYLLNEFEVLAEKILPADVEELIKDPARVKDKTRAVCYKCPQASLVQIYNYQSKKARIVVGPSLIMLGPEESFTLMNLSGGKPKRPAQIKSLHLNLNPGFVSDVVTIETADHARLKLHMSYSWHFEIDTTNQKDLESVFSVPDYVGDGCKAVASRVRGAVASIPFDYFHKNSFSIILKSVFGDNKKRFCFPNNNLVITGIDIKAVEPVDQQTSQLLQKSVHLAIEITTNALKARAKHDALCLEQEAKGRLQKQKINDMANAENFRRELLELVARCNEVERTGQAKADAESQSTASVLQIEASLEASKIKTGASKLENESALKRLGQAREIENIHRKELDAIEVAYQDQLSAIESEKFEQMVAALGADTIAKIAQAGPEMQAKLLQGLGIKTTLITDGKSPLNLLNTAQGIVAQAPKV